MTGIIEMNFKDVIFVLVIFFANIIEGITGFAGTMLAMPVSMLMIGVQEAKAVLNIVAIIVSLGIAIRNYKNVNIKEVLKISFLMMIGIVGGLYLFSLLPVRNLLFTYGILIIVVAIRGLFNKKEANLSSWMLVTIVISAGIIHGMFLSGGSLLVLYAVSVLKEKSIIRATLAPVWIILNSIILIRDITTGDFTCEVMLWVAYCIVPLVLALIIGNKLHGIIRQEVFIKLTYILLIVSGFILLV